MAADQYFNNTWRDIGVWSSINIVLAISHQLQSMKESECYERETKAWKYLRNSIVVLDELEDRRPGLLKIQALLGIVSFLITYE